MSSTRHAEANSPFRQERYASSARFERGLMGNLVARRCELLTRDEDKDLVWWLQLASWQPGGLAKLAADLIAGFPARVASPLMLKYGCKPGQIYSAEKTKAVYWELSHKTEDAESLARAIDAMDEGFGDGKPREWQPTPSAEFVAECRKLAVAELETALAGLCLNPAINLATYAPRYFPALIETLREYQAAAIESRRAGHVVTGLGRQVWDTLDYCRETRCMVLIDGLARTGKTFSARAWCELHPGAARYVQVPSSNDDIAFFRAIARACGVSINQNSKAQQLRDRIEEVLRGGQLAIVFDEAHYLWPQSNYREALPNRVNWIMTALVNQGVPVALVTTPQFMKTQQAVERKSCWTSEQFTGRIGHYAKLPDSLSKDDLAAVAKNLLPEGCAKSIKALVLYANASAKYLAAIDSVVHRARYLAAKANRKTVALADVLSAMQESVIPSDAALAAALAAPGKSRRAGTIPAPLTAPQRPVNEPLPAGKSARQPGAERNPDLAEIGTRQERPAVAA